jgi:hypothetical protein
MHGELKPKRLRAARKLQLQTQNLPDPADHFEDPIDNEIGNNEDEV